MYTKLAKQEKERKMRKLIDTTKPNAS